MEKKRKIIVSVQGRSAINASLTLSKELISNGHDVIYLSWDLDGQYIKQQGFAFYSIENFHFPKLKMADYRGLKWYELKRLRSINKQFALYKEKILENAQLWIDEYKPDVVLLHTNLLDYAPVFLKKKITIINLNSTYSSSFFKGYPSVFSNLIAQNSPSKLTLLKYKLSWKKILLLKFYVTTIEKIANIIWGALNFQSSVKAVYDAGGDIKLTEYGLRLVGPEIVLGPACLDFTTPNDYEQRYYIGNCVYNDRNDGDFDFDLIAKQNVIYCSMGTNSKRYNNAYNLYSSLFEVMKQLKDFQLILQTEGIREDAKFEIPENVLVFAKVPQIEMLKRARLFITHGGFSSVRESIYYGVPMLVFPGWHDQFGNAARVSYHKIGLAGNMKTVTPRRLSVLINNVINSSEILSAVSNKQAEIRQDDDLKLSVKYIEQYF